jgi:hypothetical protein
MTTEWLPTGHRPPLPRIETKAVHKPPPARTVEQLMDDIAQQVAWVKEGERAWKEVVETARST